MKREISAPLRGDAAPTRHLAMDLGTGSTCVAGAIPPTGSTEDPLVEVVRPDGWSNAALGGAIPTVILYKDNEPFLIGSAAEHEFGEATKDERRRYTMRSQFKPDVAVNGEARRHMEDFLRLLRPRIGEPKNLLAGLPCLAENHYRRALRQCFLEAGFGDVLFLREPLGAVINAVAGGILPPSVAARGLLVVDFGGGTCDLAVLRRADIIGCHGDMLYGGRLFDDLIYQILLKRNPKLEPRLEAEGNAHYVHWIACRTAKEEFSRAMDSDPCRKISLRVRWSNFRGREVSQESAYIADLGWDEFLDEAGNYRASRSFLKQLAGHGDRAGHSSMAEGLLAGKQVDLISWFEHILARAVDQSGLAASLDGIPTVLLTGGSSSWPFVKQLVRHNLGEFAAIHLSAEPYADIAKGLAQHGALSASLRRGRASLREDLPLFMEKNIRRKIIRQSLDAGISRVWRQCAELLRDVVIMPEFTRFREQGGRMDSILANVTKTAQKEEERLATIMIEGLSRLGKTIAEECRAELRAWFAEKGITILPERLEHDWLNLELHVFLTGLIRDMGTEKLLGIHSFKEIMAAASAGGKDSATIFPALSAALTASLNGLLQLTLHNVNKILPLPSTLRKSLFSEKRALALCNQQMEIFGQGFREHVLKEWAEAEARILGEAARVAQEEIAALDVLDISPI